MPLDRYQQELRPVRVSAAGRWILAACLILFPFSATWADSWTAITDWAQRLELGPLVGGAVSAAYVETGDRVTAGMELMQIDQTPYLHRVRASEARVESARVDFESSRQHYDRQTELFDIGSLSTVQLEESSYALVRAESAYTLAKAELELARYDLDKTTVRAPIDGWIIDKRVFVGQSLSTTQMVPVSYVVAPAGEYIAIISPPPDTAMLATVGTLVEIEINGEIFEGKIAFPRASGDTEPRQVTARFIAEDKLIHPGTRSTVRISR